MVGRSRARRYHTHGAWSLAGSFLLLTGMLAFDFAVSKTPMRNVERLRTNGYNTQAQIGSFVWVWVVSHAGGKLREHVAAGCTSQRVGIAV